MHDAHLGRVFLFLEILAEYALLSVTVMVTPCLLYVVGVKLVMSYVKFPLKPRLYAPLLTNAEIPGFLETGLFYTDPFLGACLRGATPFFCEQTGGSAFFWFGLRGRVPKSVRVQEPLNGPFLHGLFSGAIFREGKQLIKEFEETAY